MSRRKPPVLRPSAAPARTPLPAAVPLLALLGLALLGFYGVPAVVEHDRLERDHARLEEKAHAAQALLEQRRRELRAERRQAVSRKHATKNLMNDGMRYLESRKR